MDEVERLRKALEKVAWTLRNETYALQVGAALSVIDMALTEALSDNLVAEGKKVIKAAAHERGQKIAEASRIVRVTIIPFLRLCMSTRPDFVDALETLVEAQREPYRILWDALKKAGIDRGDGCPDSILWEEIKSRDSKLAEAQAEVERLKKLASGFRHDFEGAAVALAAERETIRILREANGTLVNSMLVMARHSSVLTVRS